MKGSIHGEQSSVSREQSGNNSCSFMGTTGELGIGIEEDEACIQSAG